jgi:hypothetical protein
VRLVLKPQPRGAGGEEPGFACLIPARVLADVTGGAGDEYDLLHSSDSSSSRSIDSAASSVEAASRTWIE